MQTSHGTYAMGGDNYGGRATKDIFKLDCPGDQIQSCQWIKVGNLQIVRSAQVSFALPESYDICRA